MRPEYKEKIAQYQAMKVKHPKKLKVYLRAEGLTDRDMIEIMGVSRSRLRQAYEGNAPILLMRILKYAEDLGLNWRKFDNL